MSFVRSHHPIMTTVNNQVTQQANGGHQSTENELQINRHLPNPINSKYRYHKYNQPHENVGKYPIAIERAVRDVHYAELIEFHDHVPEMQNLFTSQTREPVKEKLPQVIL